MATVNVPNRVLHSSHFWLIFHYHFWPIFMHLGCLAGDLTKGAKNEI
jgi:hypothetical protein